MKKISKSGSFSILALGLCLAVASCNKTPNQSTAQQQSTDQSATQQPSPDQQAAQPGSDPAQANVTPVSQQDESQTPAPAQQATGQQSEPTSSYQGNDQTVGYDTADADYGEQPVEAEQPPPSLPDYSQPECPGENYIWTPGYWGYASNGYYWVPGAWVVAPYVGSLWTPPYWAFFGGRYRWHRGYWGPHIGFYGGINYGFGYTGRGYEGGYWRGGVFDYNRSVNNVNTTIVHNVYNYTVINNTTRVCYNGGPGGLNVRPTPAEVAVLHQQRIAPVPAQVQHMQQAAANRAQFAAVNHGRPQTLVAARPLATTYKAPAPHPAAVPGARVIPPVNARTQAAPTPQTRAQMQPNGRPGEPAGTRSNPMTHAPAAQPRVEPRPAPATGTAVHGPPNVRPGTPAQPAARTPQPPPAHPEEGPAARTPQPPPARPEERPATRTPQPPPARPAAHPATPNHAEPEARPTPAPARQEAKPAPARHSAPPAHDQKKESKESNDTKR